MKVKKKQILFLLPIVLIVFVLVLVGFLRQPEMTKEERLTKDVTKNHEELSSLLQDNRGEHIKNNHPSFKSFATLFSVPLVGVDTRKTEYAILSFECPRPEASIYLYYAEDDLIDIGGEHIVTADNPEINLENLGVNGKGYIHCVRLQEGWFFYDSYIPT